jgi:hypothetical protein
MAQAGTYPAALEVGAIIRILSIVGIIAIGALLFEYMSDGTICNKAFNGLCIATALLLVANICFSIYGAVVAYSTFALDTFNALYRITMVFLCTFFAYDSAKIQLKKANLAK